MTILYNLEQLKEPLRNPVLTIGNFDGVHKGHLVLFDLIKERAKKIDGQSVVMTFDPHPTKVTMPKKSPRLITPTKQKLKLIDDAGIDVIFCIPFTKELSSISARDFVQNILVDKIGVREIVVGYDYSFGHNREGNIALLKDMGNHLGFSVHVVEQVRINQKPVSSTSIRNLVTEGHISRAKKLLGRDYQVCGTVVKGKSRGAMLLGFPTANIELIDELIPKVGVYAVKVIIDDTIYKGVTNIGYNPTFGDNQFSVETHILDFSGDLLGKTIRVNFIERLRYERTFESLEELSDQIAKDIRQARQLFELREGD
jgi:riboflavin kinase/FMN adenylyltransferase